MEAKIEFIDILEFSSKEEFDTWKMGKSGITVLQVNSSKSPYDERLTRYSVVVRRDTYTKEVLLSKLNSRGLGSQQELLLESNLGLKGYTEVAGNLAEGHLVLDDGTDIFYALGSFKETPVKVDVLSLELVRSKMVKAFSHNWNVKMTWFGLDNTVFVFTDGHKTYLLKGDPFYMMYVLNLPLRPRDLNIFKNDKLLSFTEFVE